MHKAVKHGLLALLPTFRRLTNLRCLKSNFTKCGFDFFITVVGDVRFDKTVWSCEHDFEKCTENGVKV